MRADVYIRMYRIIYTIIKRENIFRGERKLCHPTNRREKRSQRVPSKKRRAHIGKKKRKGEATFRPASPPSFPTPMSHPSLPSPPRRRHRSLSSLQQRRRHETQRARPSLAAGFLSSVEQRRQRGTRRDRSASAAAAGEPNPSSYTML